MRRRRKKKKWLSSFRTGEDEGGQTSTRRQQINWKANNDQMGPNNQQYKTRIASFLRKLVRKKGIRKKNTF